MEHIKIKIKFKHIVIAALVVVAAIMLKFVNAGLTPQERAEWEYKTKVGVAEALAKSSHPLVPEIMMASDSKGGAGNAMDAVGLNMLMDLTNKLSSK